MPPAIASGTPLFVGSSRVDADPAAKAKLPRNDGIAGDTPSASGCVVTNRKPCAANAGRVTAEAVTGAGLVGTTAVTYDTRRLDTDCHG